MERLRETVTVSLPIDLVREVEQLKSENGPRPANDVIREALEEFIASRKWREIYRYGELKALESGITEDQIEDIIDELRK